MASVGVVGLVRAAGGELGYVRVCPGICSGSPLS